MKFKDKLKLLEVDLKVWNHEVFGHMENKKKILKDIEVLDNQDADGELEGSDKMKRMELVSLLRVTNKKIESIISQKA